MQLIVLLGAELDIHVAFNRFEEYREVRIKVPSGVGARV